MTILAIDAGTTGVTALLVSPVGEVLSTGYAEFPQHFPADGCVEHELGEIWAATLAATRHALTWGDVTITANATTDKAPFCSTAIAILSV
jgi:glycerol kinase